MNTKVLSEDVVLWKHFITDLACEGFNFRMNVEVIWKIIPFIKHFVAAILHALKDVLYSSSFFSSYSVHFKICTYRKSFFLFEVLSIHIVLTHYNITWDQFKLEKLLYFSEFFSLSLSIDLLSDILSSNFISWLLRCIIVIQVLFFFMNLRMFCIK